VGELRRLLWDWVLGMHDDWELYTANANALGLLAPYPNYPLPAGFLFDVTAKVSETMEWIHEYSIERTQHDNNEYRPRRHIHYRYQFEFGFGGYTDHHESAVWWGIKSGEFV
jgi:hypothetical protein